MPDSGTEAENITDDRGHPHNVRKQKSAKKSQEWGHTRGTQEPTQKTSQWLKLK